MKHKKWKFPLIPVVAVVLMLGVAVYLLNLTTATPEVYFYPASPNTNPIRLDRERTELILHLVGELRDRSANVTVRQVFLVAGIGRFRVDGVDYEWHRNLIFCWDRQRVLGLWEHGQGEYVIIKNDRLGRMYNSLRASHFEFDPSTISQEEWESLLNGL